MHNYRILALMVFAAASGLCGGAPGARAASTGTLDLSSATYSVAQNATSVAVAVTRVGGSSGTATVSFSTADGTAVAGKDYQAQSWTLSWANGDASPKYFWLHPINAVPFSGTKSFVVHLASAKGAALGSVATATVSIKGDGSSTAAGTTLELSASSYSVAQNGKSLTVTVDRSGSSTGAASIKYTTIDGTALAGTDYTKAAGTVSWAAGDSNKKTFAVNILDAKAFSGTKSFSVQLSAPSGATPGAPATAVVTIDGSATAASGGSGPAAKLAAKLGRPSRLLVGLGGQGLGVDSVSAIQAQAIKSDIYQQYLGTGDWTSWGSAPCDYVCRVAAQADSLGAIPMFTQYQMANSGDGNLTVITNSAFMTTYWNRVRMLYQDLGTYNKPALVNLEPDFWGYVERHATNADPTKMTAIVSTNPDCASLPNNVTGIAECLITMARKYAPKTYVGFPPSSWGGDTDAEIVTYMNLLGAQNADFIVEQTLDRDAGCFEAYPTYASYCGKPGNPLLYWDESNVTHPNFHDHLASALIWHQGIGNLPIIWWQTPEGVPSSTPGGTPFHFRDNRVHYFLTHPAELTAVGGLGVVFSTGEDHQTNITTDGGQFQNLDREYLAAPAPLP